MKFKDKLTAAGKPEVYSNGEPTGRFESKTETHIEAAVLRAALTNVALCALQSEQQLTPEDAKMLVDFLNLDQLQSEHLTLTIDQAKRLSRLIKRGTSSITIDLASNQFDQQKPKVSTVHTLDELIHKANSAASSLSVEADARSFRNNLTGEVTIDDILGFTEETKE